MALRRAAKGGAVKTPRQLCFLSPRPRKVMVTEVKEKPVVVRRILRVDSSTTTPRRLRFISSPVLPKKKKCQPQEDVDDDEDTAGEGEDAVSQLVGVDIEEQEQKQEELKAAVDEKDEDIFFSAQEEEEEEEEEDDDDEEEEENVFFLFVCCCF